MTDPIPALRELFPPQLRERVFLVGGTVRDLLLGREGKDLDLAAALPGDFLRDAGFRRVAGKSTAPIWFRHDPRHGTIEITPLAEPAALEDDLLRRDFTANAIALTLEGGFIDPLGGRGDLEQRILRPCSPRCFRDDPIRIFRLFRFAAQGWQPAEEAERLIGERSWDAELAALPVERFSREMVKALGGAEPEAFFRLMLRHRVGECWLPELFRMPAIPAGPVEHHPEGDLFSHSCRALAGMAGAGTPPLVQFCAFFHDLGKLATAPESYPRHLGHDEAGAAMAGELCRRLALPTSWQRALTATSRLHLKAGRWNELRDTTRLRLAGDARKGGIAPFLPALVAADREAAEPMAGWEEALEAATAGLGELGVTEERLAEIPPEQRTPYLQQLRVELFRSRTGGRDGIRR